MKGPVGANRGATENGREVFAPTDMNGRYVLLATNPAYTQLYGMTWQIAVPSAIDEKGISFAIVIMYLYAVSRDGQGYGCPFPKAYSRNSLLTAQGS